MITGCKIGITELEGLSSVIAGAKEESLLEGEEIPVSSLEFYLKSTYKLDAIF